MGTDNGCTAGSATGVHGAQYYRFEDPSGRVHLVDSISSVPQALRARAVCIEYPDTPASLPSVIAHAAAAPNGYQIFGFGFATALVAAFVFSRLPGSLRFFARLAIVGGGVALLAGLYFGWLHRTAGQSTDTFAGPGALLQDAKDAVAKMNARSQAEQAELKDAVQAK